MSNTTPTTIYTREGLPYPITVDQLLPSVGDNISKGDRLFAYKFWYVVEIANSPDDNETVEKAKKSVRESIEFFESPFEGILLNWNIEIGNEIINPNQPICEMQRPCNHDIVYGGLCTLCGKEVDELEQQAIGGANLAISHTDVNLKVSRKAANDINKDIKQRLNKEKKLVLVVDLDQTVIHCGVDPTIGEWKNDPKNPNYETLKDVKLFSLEEEPIVPFMYMGPKPPLRKCWYYVKVRPGLKEFFEKVAPLFEMHIYTMATRAYALEIAKIIDPEGNLFCDRILSRDENGSMTQKSLERLFPSDQSMVVIIDDRGDVWNWSPNLIKVVPYNFFVGVGDINSNFLPKQQTTMLQMGRRSRTKAKETDELLSDIMNTEKRLQEKINQEVKRQEEKLNLHQLPVNEEPKPNETKEEWTKKLEYSASVEVQQKNRPLATLQEHLHNQRLLIDDDDELYYLKDTLANIHSEYYKIKGESSEVDNIRADIKYILPNMKEKVFNDCNFVFSGLIPLSTDVQRADIVVWTNKFGAHTTSEIDDNTTHVITKTPGTYKARLAKSFNPDIKIVHPDWIFECLIKWKRVDEKLYTLIVDQPVTSEELNQFTQKLQEKKKRREQEEEEEHDSFDLDDESIDSGVVTNSINLFTDGASWLNDDDEDIPYDDEDDEDDEDEGEEDDNDEFKSGTEQVSNQELPDLNKKRPAYLSDNENESETNKKVHLTTENNDEDRNNSDSSIDDELLNMLDS